MTYKLLKLTLILLLFSCSKAENSFKYTVSGHVTNQFGVGIKGVKISYDTSEFTLTDDEGYWIITDLYNQHTITPTLSNYTFTPSEIQVNAINTGLTFLGTQNPTKIETQIFNWFNNQQLSNGLLESAEHGNNVSLYDNALAAMVFMLEGDFSKAEKLFNFFNARINTELTSGVGGFSQFRDKNGVPNNYRWMGDNAWLLIALNNYKAITGKTTYDVLASKISSWLKSLQDTDGGLFAGYDANNNLMNNKVTEGNIDAFNAISGYTDFHSHLLNYLKLNRWDASDKNLVAWPSNQTYLHALDVQSWSYAIFKNYPISALTSAKRFLTTQTATNGAQITGYCFDEDKDVVWLEGTGQMALDFGMADMTSEKTLYLANMEKVLIQSTEYLNAAGFPYASNPGTGYGSGKLWTSADTEIAISGGAWYLFASYNFNPFAVGHDKNIPTTEMFWLH